MSTSENTCLNISTVLFYRLTTRFEHPAANHRPVPFRQDRQPACHARKTMQNPVIQSFFDPGTFTVSHVVSDPTTRQAAIIDSVLDFDPKAGRTSYASADRIIGYVRQGGMKIEWLLETHAHADHLSAAPYLKEKLGGNTGIGIHIREVQSVFKKVFNAKDMNTEGVEFDKLFDDGELFRIGELEVRVLHTPGHTPACLTYVIGRDAFVGDTLFMPDYGTARCDFPGGDSATLYRSIRKVLALSPDTRLHL
ncbi:MAG: MBL fold metallo-hydrolase, partial [Candidatus Methylophosphatis roskildensis]